jgi:PadR family transcriptional regulator PadR
MVGTLRFRRGSAFPGSICPFDCSISLSAHLGRNIDFEMALTNFYNDGIYLAMQDDLPAEIEAWRSQLRKGSLELAVLIALRKQPRYGLELVDLLNKVKLGISEGSIYPLLARLRAEKKVVAEWIDAGVGHSHKYYELTDVGRATLKAMWRSWREFGAAYDHLMEDNGE